MVQELDSLIRGAGPWAMPVLAGAACVEYVFPPFPGDTITLLGGVLAVRGDLPVVQVYLAIVAGSIAGSLFDWGVGRALGRRLFDRPIEERPRFLRLSFLRPEALAGWEERFRRRGAWYLAVNRFLPAFRAPLFFAAGVSRVPLWKVVVFGGLSSAVWNALLFAAGYALGDQAERLEGMVRHYTVAVLALAVGIALLLLLRRARSHRYAARNQEALNRAEGPPIPPSPPSPRGTGGQGGA